MISQFSLLDYIDFVTKLELDLKRAFDNMKKADSKGGFLKSSKLVELQKAMRKVSAEETVLRHTSPYDEMVGGPEKTSSNALEVPLADNKLY